MKLIHKTLALMLACSAVGLAQAGNFEWRTTNNTPTLQTYELDAAIRQGLESADPSLPDLPKPWYLHFTIGYFGTNDYEPKPYLILIQKIRSTPAGRAEEACKRMSFGVLRKTKLLEDLREQAQYAAGYVTSAPECIVNDPAAPPAKKSSKK